MRQRATRVWGCRRTQPISKTGRTTTVSVVCTRTQASMEPTIMKHRRYRTSWCYTNRLTHCAGSTSRCSSKDTTWAVTFFGTWRWCMICSRLLRCRGESGFMGDTAATIRENQAATCTDCRIHAQSDWVFRWCKRWCLLSELHCAVWRGIADTVVNEVLL